MPKEGLSAVIGYAIGTAQILVLDWLRARWSHARQLRLLRADLRRVADFREKFGYTLDAPPETDRMPRPASFSSTFVTTLGAVDFWITDEHKDDNTQEALLGAADGIAALAEVHANALKEIQALQSTDDRAKKKDHLERLVEYTQEYDREVDYVQYVIQDSLRDLERRLRVVRWWWQVLRIFLPRRKGINPPPLKRGDPRLAARQGIMVRDRRS